MTTRLSIAALVSALWVGQAGATDRYVSPSGSGTACTPGSPCALGTANTSAQPGDIIRMADGTYSTEPVPSTGSATNTSPIRYIGNTTNISAVMVPSITNYHKPGVQWRAITINGTVRLSDASNFNGIPNRWLKLDRCRIRGSLQIRNTSNSSIDSCSIDTLTNGQQNIIRIQPGEFDNGLSIYEKLMDSDTLSNNAIKLTSGMASIPGDNQTQWVFYMRDCVSSYGSGCPTTDGGSVISNLVFDRNVVDIYCPQGNPVEGDWRPWYISTGAGTVFRNNRWTIRYYTSNSGGTAWRLRDKTHNVTWDGDTLTVIGNNGVIQMSSQSGGAVQSDQHDNVWKNCFFDNQSTGCPYPPFNFQWGMVNVTLQRNVFKSSISTGGEILDVGDIQGTSNLIDHNTFVSFDPNCAPLTVLPGNWGTTSSLTVTNNISYLPGTSTSGSNQAGAVIDVWANRTFNLNNNLYAFYGKNSTPGDRAVRFRYNCGAGCTGYQYSAAGANGALAQTTGKDVSSVYGSALFSDSTRSTFDPDLNTGSAAIGRGTSGTDIGAVPFAGVDVTPPSPVGGLATSLLTDQNAVLTWTASGDDGMNGIASAYEMRYAVGSLNDGNFSSGTLVSGLPTPAAPGTPQSVAIAGLTASTGYTFGIRVRDEAGNWSAVSYLTVNTTAGDQAPPARITDLGP